MTEPRLRARSISEIVDAAFQLYRQNAPQYIALTALAYVPWLLVRLLFLPTVTVTPGMPQLSTTQLVVTMVTGFGNFLTIVLMSGVIVQLGADDYLGSPEAGDASGAVRRVLPRVPSLILAGIYKYLLSILGLICFLVGLFYVAARYFAVATSVVLENRSAGQALSRSSELAKGRKWHILGTLVLVWLIYLVLSMAVGLIAGLTRSAAFVSVVPVAFTIVAYPIVALAEMVLYYDARIRGEGFDIEVMAQGLEGGAAAT